MRYVNLVAHGTNHEVKAIALNGVMSALTGTETLKNGTKIEWKRWIIMLFLPTYEADLKKSLLYRVHREERLARAE